MKNAGSPMKIPLEITSEAAALSPLNWQQFKKTVKETLHQELPGLEAHLELAPQFRIPQMMELNIPDRARKSSVLILLFPENNAVKTVVIVRQNDEGVHSGQVALPGGRQEPQDLDHWHTALREAYEEIGVEPGTVEKAGELSPLYINRSNYLVYPFVGFLDKKPPFIPQHTEVKELLVFDLFQTVSFPNRVIREIKINETTRFQAPGYLIQNAFFMWGATAMIFNELMRLIGN